MIGLTPTQMDGLRVIIELKATFGRSPTLEEICHEMGFASRASAKRLVACLEDREALVRNGREIEVLASPPEIELYEIEITEAGRGALAH